MHFSILTQDEVIEDKSMWLRIWILRFNPIVTFLSVVIIWGFIGGCIADPVTADGYLKKGKVSLSPIVLFRDVVNRADANFKKDMCLS